MRTTRHRNADALAVLSSLALVSFIAAVLYFARGVLIPLSVAALLTFLLTPVVVRLERFVGRIAAVVLVVSMIFAGTGVVGYVLTQQLFDLATRLPSYKENIVSKLHSLKLPRDKRLEEFTRTVAEVSKEMPGAAAAPAGRGDVVISKPAGEPAKVEIVEAPGVTLVQTVAAWVVGPLGTAALVLVLCVCMLLQREDLRRRFISLAGHGHIGAATRAMDDAAQRVSRFLLMQASINLGYGTVIGVGLYFIGVPNAVLWGGISAVLRFVPYVGVWIGAFFPIVLSFAVTPGWVMPIETVALFIVVELLCFNLLEPWLYGSSTGVSAISLIVAAVFWTWLWGPLGLALATPLTVVLVVVGRHVPQFAFLSVLLGDEEPLTPAQDCYQRLLTPGDRDEMDLVESFLKAGSLASLYDEVLIPALTAAETDLRLESIDREELSRVHEGLRDIVDELEVRLPSAFENEDGSSSGAEPLPPCSVLCLAARAERDMLGGAMLSHLLQQYGCKAEVLRARVVTSDVISAAQRRKIQVACIAIVAPSNVLHAQHLCRSLQSLLPELKIVVGLWGFDDEPDGTETRLREAGAHGVTRSLADTLVKISDLAPSKRTPVANPVAIAARV